MKTVREVMTHDVRLVAPEDDLRSAAQAMAEADCGALPVGKNDRLVGVLTDRDITLRVIAAGIAPEQCTVGDIMSVGIKYVFDDEPIEAAARNMATLQMRRLPVLNREKRLVGIVSLGDLATENGAAGKHAIRGVSRHKGNETGADLHGKAHRSQRTQKQEDHLDKALAESFPASDPVSLTNPSIGVQRPHARKKAG
jgi:CBS domain-containing protein